MELNYVEVFNVFIDLIKTAMPIAIFFITYNCFCFTSYN